jgi:hypothetical protein
MIGDEEFNLYEMSTSSVCEMASFSTCAKKFFWANSNNMLDRLRNVTLFPPKPVFEGISNRLYSFIGNQRI